MVDHLQACFQQRQSGIRYTKYITSCSIVQICLLLLLLILFFFSSLGCLLLYYSLLLILILHFLLLSISVTQSCAGAKGAHVSLFSTSPEIVTYGYLCDEESNFSPMVFYVSKAIIITVYLQMGAS